MIKDYTTYYSIDFLKDEDFLRWQLFHSEEDDLFWASWIENHPLRNEEVQEAIRLFSSLEMNKNSFLEEEKREMLRNIYKTAQAKKRKRIIYSLSAAACIIVLVAVGFFTLFLPKTKESTTLSHIQIEEKSNDIQLVLSDNQVLNFQNDADIIYNDKGEVFVNSSGSDQTPLKVRKEKSQTNKLIVPKGKRSSLKLADGSHVWVNAGTTLEFPATFDSKKRELFVNGEIYIQVAKDSRSPFYVNTEKFAVKVLGTRFNVSAYDGEDGHTVVLEEGSVEVIPSNSTLSKVQLKPEESLQFRNNSYNIEKVNVYDYISWKDGLLQFQSEPLPSVLSRLERYYGIPIQYDSLVQNMRCTGKLVLFDDVHEVLKVIMRSVPIKVEEKSNVIYIKKNENK